MSDKGLAVTYLGKRGQDDFGMRVTVRVDIIATIGVDQLLTEVCLRHWQRCHLDRMGGGEEGDIIH
jgi:hypothetical protein